MKDLSLFLKEIITLIDIHMDEKEMLTSYLKSKAKHLGIDYGERNKQKGIVTPGVVLGLLGVGFCGAYAIRHLKNKLPQMMNSAQMRHQANGNIYPMSTPQFQQKVEPEPTVKPLQPILLMLKALNKSINERNYTSFIQLALQVRPLFQYVDLTDSATVFDKIESEGILGTLETFINSAEAEHPKKIILDNHQKLTEFTQITQQTATGEILLLHTNKSLLERASKENITPDDPGFKDTLSSYAVLILDQQIILLQI